MSLNVHQWAMSVARITAQRGNCARRKVGCAILNYHNDLVSVGWNGVVESVDITPQGVMYKSCEQGAPCPGAKARSGTCIDECYAVHAEQMAILNCSNKNEMETIYLTCSPCISCVKLLVHTNISTIIFENEYPNSETSKQLWLSTGERKWLKFNELTI